MIHDVRPMARRPLRLLHFDLKSLTNYGDTVLFDAVRQMFNGFAGGGVFEMLETFSLHRHVGNWLVDEINESFDAIVLGGGGLFLRDTNPNENSGWQWNIPLPVLMRLRKPLIVFAVGYNRFPGQEDFAPVFATHVAQCVRQSCFFGLRNRGSIDAIRSYLPADLHGRVELQPCPTTLGTHLYPDLTAGDGDRSPDPHLGVELMVDRRMVAAGYDFDRLFDRHAAVLRRLQADGWRVDTVAHMANERHVAEELGRRGVDTAAIDLAGSVAARERGLAYYGSLPIMYGARGHATMIPFGMGAIPLGALVHDKVRFFLDDIGHPELGVDPGADDFEQRAHDVITGAHARQDELRLDLTRRRDELFKITMANLATIYERLTGKAIEPSLRPYTPFERKLSDQAFAVAAELQKTRAWGMKRGETIAALERRVAELASAPAESRRASDPPA